MTVVMLAGGTGGAKLARGMLDVVGDELVVVANTGDDIEIHGAHVSPDPDLALFWLADRIDARGWGLAGDTFHAMDRLRERGADVWFNLGDEDLEISRDRLRRLRAGERLLWFWCRSGANGCQRTLEVRPQRAAVAPGGQLPVTVTAYDDHGKGVPAAGATVRLGSASAVAGDDGVATLTVPGETGTLGVVATQAKRVRSFPAEVIVG